MFVCFFVIFLEIIRILHECDLRMNKSVPRDTVWYREVCQVMLKSDPRDIFVCPYLTLM